MGRRTLSVVLGGAALVSAFAAPAHGQPRLTGITVFRTDTLGNYVSPLIWNTNGDDGAYNVWVTSGAAPDGPFLNGPDDVAAAIDIPLADGDNVFTFYAPPGIVESHFGIGLYLDHSERITCDPNVLTHCQPVPGRASISAYAPVDLSAVGDPTFQENLSTSVANFYDSGAEIPAGVLSAVAGGKAVTLTAYRFSAPSVENRDRVGPYATGPDETNDFIGSFVLRVSDPIMLSGLIVFGATGDGRAMRPYWNTLGLDGYANLWVLPCDEVVIALGYCNLPSVPFSNGPSDAGAALSMPLAERRYELLLRGDSFDPSADHTGINVFLETDTSVPRLSALVRSGSKSVFANASRETLALDAATAPGANATQYQIGDKLITIDQFWFDTLPSNQPCVSDVTSALENTPGGECPDSEGRLRLKVQRLLPSPSPTPTPTFTRTATATSTSTRTRSSTPSVTPSATPSLTATRTYTVTRSVTSTTTNTRTPTASATPSLSATITLTVTRTRTPTLTATVPTRTPTPSVTRTITPTLTRTETPTPSPSVTRTYTATLTLTPTATRTRTNTASNTPTASVTVTLTVTRTRTPTLTATMPTRTPTPSVTRSITPTLTRTETPTPTPSPSVTRTYTASRTLTPTATSTRTLTASHTPTLSVTITLTVTRTRTPTLTAAVPTRTPTPSVTSSITPTRTDAPTPSPSPSVTRTYTAMPTLTPTTTSTRTNTATDTPTPSVTLTLTTAPTGTPSQTATLPTRTVTPSVTRSITPTLTRTETPTAKPTPSVTPTGVPVPLLVCDVAPARRDANSDGDQLDAGEFGNATITNDDVVALFRASLLVSERPPLSSDLFSAMDAAQEDIPPTCGGDGRLANNDVVICFRRSLVASLPLYERRGAPNECTSQSLALTAR